MTTYVIFTYDCESLNWIKHGATIGYNIPNDIYENHPLSETNDIACLNEPLTNWANVVYLVTGNTIV